MYTFVAKRWTFVFVLLLLSCGMACDLTSGGDDGTGQPQTSGTEEITATPTPSPEEPTSEPVVELAATPTPTPTPTVAPIPVVTDTPMPNACANVSGEIEVRILVGPADAVGLEPEAVGSVPFAVTSIEAPYLVQGGGNINFYDVLVEEWGTYEVTLNAQISISGECVTGAESLDLILEMTGDQLVEVQADGFQGTYPWAGTQTFNLSFPIAEGATAEGEGWLFVLHVNVP